MNIYARVLTTILRYLLLLIVPKLAKLGVGEADQNALVDAIVTYIVPVIMMIAMTYWSYTEKRWIPALITLAFHAKPGETTIPELVDQAKSSS
jgi:hypothetical protein